MTAKTTSLKPPLSLSFAERSLRLEAAPLGVAGQHPEDVPRPDRGLVAAHAGADLEDHVLGVGRIGLDERELQLLLQSRDVGGQIVRERGELGVAAGGVEVGARLSPLLRELVRRFQLLQPTPHLGSLPVVVVDRGIGHAGAHLLVGALEVVDQLVDGGHGP